MGTYRAVVEAGGLTSLFSARCELFRRTAIYVDRILKGSKPGDLPIELPTKFLLAVNVKTAKAIGVIIPQPLLLQADMRID